MSTSKHDEALQDVFTQLTRLGVDIETLAGRFAHHTRLQPTDVRALRVLSASTSDMTASELGDRLALTSGATTRMVDRLEAAGYLTRIRSTTDRRVVYLRLTDQAWAAAEAFFGRVGSAVIGALRGRFSGEELATVARFLRCAAAAMQSAGSRSR